MEETDDSVTAPVRRTRSAAAKSPKAKPKSQKPKPLSKKTKKKVVMMEVEVSDDEDESVGENDEKSNDEQSSNPDKENSEEVLKDAEEKLELNGKGSNDSKISEDPEIVINDVGMIAEDTNSRAEEKKDSKGPIEKMEVDEDENFITINEEKLEKQKESVAEKIQSVSTTEKTDTELTTKKTDNESASKKTDNISTLSKEIESSDEPKSKKPKLEEVNKVEETKEKLTDEVKPKKPEEKAIVDKIKDKEITEKETKPEKSEEKQKTVEKEETKISEEKSEEKPKPVEKSEEKQKPVEKSEEKQKPVEKSEEKQKPVEKSEEKQKPVEKSEEKQKPAEKTEDKQKPADKSEDKQKSEEKPVEKVVEISDEKSENKQKSGEKPAEKEVIEKSEEKTAEKEVTEISDEKSKEVTKISDEKSEDKQNVQKEASEISDEKSEDKPAEKELSEKSENKQKPIEKAATETSDEKAKEGKADNQTADPDAENISEDELPTVQAAKVPEAEEVSDEELPGPKRAELPADTEVVSEDELPTVKNEGKKESAKRKLNETDYDPGSPTSESEAPAKKPALDTSAEKEKEDPKKPKKLPELDKYWKAVNDDPTDFTGWTYLLQYVDQENDMEAAREAYDAFLSHYPYCYGYWRKYADYEKRKGNKKKCEEVFERGLKAIPLSVDLWIHYLTYVKTTRTEDEEFIRSQFERALAACGLEFRSDRLWDSYIKWETEGKRLQKVTCIYDRLLATPTQGYTSHFDNFQEHISSNPPNKVIEVDEFLALRKEVRQILKNDVSDAPPADSDAPPGDEDQTKVVSSDEETKSIRERIVSIRRKMHKSTVNSVTARWNYEEGIKRPYFHVKPLERCQLKNWQDYLDYETEQGEKTRIIVLFERCLIACALYEEFWLKFVHYLESLKDTELQTKIRDVYERACTIHHLKKPNLHLQWAMFEEGVGNATRAAEILVNLEKSVPNVLQIAYRRINLERRRGEHEKCTQLYEHYINNSKNKMISSSISIKYSRFCYVIVKDLGKAQEILKSAITKDPNNPRLYLQLIDLTLQKENVTEKEIVDIFDMFLEKDSSEPEQKVLFAQRKLEYLEDFGSDIHSMQTAHEQYHKLLKANKEGMKKKESKSNTASSEATPVTSKSVKDKPAPPSSSTSGAYGQYGQYGNSGQPNYPYSGNQQGPNYYPQYGQGDQQYQYQNWQYPPQGGYGGYNQWGGYSGGYGY